MDPKLFEIDPELLDAADTGEENELSQNGDANAEANADAELSPTGEESEKNEAEDAASELQQVPETPTDANAEANAEELKLPPLRKKHERKTFATHTLKIIHSRIQYYKKVINKPPPEDPKQLKRYENLKKKYESNIRKRNLLKKAVKNLYI